MILLKYFSFNFPFILIFYWSLKKPEHLGYGLIFFAGVINDVVIGFPIGMSSFTYLLICGFAAYLKNKKKKILIRQGLSGEEDNFNHEQTKVNWWILGGSLIFVIFTLSVGSLGLPFAQEIVFLGSMLIILFLKAQALKIYFFYLI